MKTVLLLLLLTGPVQAETYPGLYFVTGVAANDVLNIRAEPSADAPIVGMLTPDSTGVEIVAEVDGWGVVNVGGQTGYANLRFLERSDGLDWNQMAKPVICAGTEPFWKIEIDPANSAVRFSGPEEPQGHLTGIRRIWAGLPWAPSTAISTPEGTMILTPAECSDGMSERRYGIAVDVFLDREGSPRMSGCCTLTIE